MIHSWKALILFICLAFPFASAQAQSDEAFIKYRQDLMEAIGGNMGAIGDTLKNKLPYQDNIATHAQGIHLASQLITSAFKKDVSEGATDAKPDIWKEWEKFAAAADKLGQESEKLAQVAASGDMEAIGAQVKTMGKACGNCHKPFRKPKEESYKRSQ